MGHLYIVGTPIGNLEDISLRAIGVLRVSDFVLAEDTRVAKKILNYFEIPTPTISFHEHSKEGVYKKIFNLLREGKSLALVTDAGMPGVSDPGAKLVSRVRNELPEIKIESIPGPSALTSAISVAGLPTTGFHFVGFAPHKKGRQTFFKSISKKVDRETSVIFFESPHRIMKTLESLKEFAPKNDVVVVKELTKIHEEVFRGRPEEISEFFKENSDKLRGEFVVIVY